MAFAVPSDETDTLNHIVVDSPDAQTTRRAASLRRLGVLALILAGCALRLYKLGADSLWYDETVSVSLAQRTVAGLIAHTAGDIHPPGYYLLLHAWRTLSSPSLGHGLEFLYAWPSVAASVVTLALIYVVARRMLGETAALAALGLAALSPFQIWYAQEVRMYAIAGALGLLCLWATLRWLQDGRAGWLVTGALATAAGMYVLYYFAFLLAGLLVAALILTPSWRRWLWWVAGMVGAAILYLPWTGVLVRQVLDPPVPPWRAPWASLSEFVSAQVELVAAPLVGQSLPQLAWLAALIVAALSVLFVLRAGGHPRARGNTPERGNRPERWAVLACLWVGPALMVLLTLFVAPVYHVRYLYPTSVFFPLVVGGALFGARSHDERSLARGGVRWLPVAALGALLAVEAASLWSFWNEPEYKADDHRGAVAALAAAWRPGDVILANAGWITPLFDVYWPHLLASGAPPALAPPTRISALAEGSALDDAANAPLVVTGSVDGASSLGWGDPQSDFFAVSRADTIAGLENLARNASRIWHYRLYDTVSDPGGVVRDWLDAHTTLLQDTAIAGRDFGRLELREVTGATDALPATPLADFGDVLRLASATLPEKVAPGATLYVTSHWQALPGLSSEPVDLSASLRLYDAADQQVLQADGGALPATSTWLPGEAHRWPMALPVPETVAPGTYFVDLILYRQNDGVPIAPTGDSPDGQRLQLGEVEIRE